MSAQFPTSLFFANVQTSCISCVKILFSNVNYAINSNRYNEQVYRYTQEVFHIVSQKKNCIFFGGGVQFIFAASEKGDTDWLGH